MPVLKSSSSWGCELKYRQSKKNGFNAYVILFVRMWVEIIFGGITLAISIVILFVRMWVEISVTPTNGLNGLVILFVRMWVEMTMQQDQLHYLPSSSSWGCELKSEAEAQGYEPCSHPLREDVSWNACTSFPQEGQNTVILFVRMWVEISIVSSDVPSLSVILFVRMWVEIKSNVMRTRTCKSHPLREDVSWNSSMYFHLPSRSSHPLREDVSWNLTLSSYTLSSLVILFVRMWVEMGNVLLLPRNGWSSSSWGCELKYLESSWLNTMISHPLREDVSWNALSVDSVPSTGCHPLREDVSWNIKSIIYCTINTVILFVRMWVEILLLGCRILSGLRHPLREDVSWNNNTLLIAMQRPGHPLREDVSWNTSPTAEPAVAKSSSSSWGCELKWRRECKRWGIHQSSSSWGCELKYKSLGRRKNVW